MAKCKGKTQADKKCRSNAWEDGFCKIHHPDRVDGIHKDHSDPIPALSTRPAEDVSVREPAKKGDPQQPKCPKCGSTKLKCQHGTITCVCGHDRYGTE